MSNHTPGPWMIRAERYRYINVYAHGGGIAHLDTVDGEGMANARLIALSPTMFDALSQWAWAEAHGDSAEMENARKARDAAISKARGEK